MLRWLCCLVAVFGWCSTAWGFELYTLPDGTHIRWKQQVVSYSIHYKASQDLGVDVAVGAIHRSFRTWEQGLQGALSFKYEGLTKTPLSGYSHKAGETNENLFIWVEKNWTHGNKVIAITLVTYDTGTGKILDADVEFNGSAYQWAVKEKIPSRGYPLHDVGKDESRALPKVDLENTTTHELGHFLGISHSANASATMFPEQGDLETKKRSLHLDDHNAIKSLYPLPFQSMSKREVFNLPEPPPTGWSCSATPKKPQSGWHWWFSLMVVSFILFSRKQ